MYVKNLQCQILRSDDDQKGLVSFVASTANADRYGDIINQNGWDLDKFRANPVILLNHNANALPIGKGEVEVIDGRLMVDVEFDMDNSGYGMKIFKTVEMASMDSPTTCKMKRPQAETKSKAESSLGSAFEVFRARVTIWIYLL